MPSSLVYDAGGMQALAPQVATVLMKVPPLRKNLVKLHLRKKAAQEHRVRDIIVPRNYEDGTFVAKCRTNLRAISVSVIQLAEDTSKHSCFIPIQARLARFHN